MVLIIIIIYIAALAFIFLYSITHLHLLWRYVFYKKKYQQAQQPGAVHAILPLITVQLPIYNEKYVAERLINCIAAFDYPRDKFEIQVLDDSTDETFDIIASKVKQLKPYINIQHIHRQIRTGYKAGALKEGLATATGELIAIFDADFLPPANYLQKIVPHFTNKKTGMVQAAWGWINEEYSLLTKLQAFALNTHFSIEQTGRNIGNNFINFNGTAGTWRKTCIEDAGNWQADTLTEDLDLSYRAQLKNWQFVYLENMSAPSELPPVMSAVKTQQYRWNKGGAETARKHLAKLLLSRQPIGVKWHGIMHLLTSGIFICVFAFAILSVPMLWIQQQYPQYHLLYGIAGFCFMGFYLLAAISFVSGLIQNSNKWAAVAKFASTFPPFLSLSMGLSLHNTIAVLEGYIGRKTPFVRTPKFNLTTHSKNLNGGNYLEKKIDSITIAEAMLAIFFWLAGALAFVLNNYSLLVFHILLAVGYSAVVYLTVFESGQQPKRKKLVIESLEAA